MKATKKQRKDRPDAVLAVETLEQILDEQMRRRVSQVNIQRQRGIVAGLRAAKERLEQVFEFVKTESADGEAQEPALQGV